jgi:Uma2 family endonuclease
VTTLIPETWWERFRPPPGMRAEIIQGQLVLLPPPTEQHTAVVDRLVEVLGAAAPLDYVAVTDFEWRVAHGTVVAALTPDVLVARGGPGRPESGSVVEALLAVEVVSLPDRLYLADGTTRIESKRARYAAEGLTHYLEVNLLARTISRYCLANCELRAVELGRMAVEANHPFPYRLTVRDLLRD